MKRISRVDVALVQRIAARAMIAGCGLVAACGSGEPSPATDVSSATPSTDSTPSDTTSGSPGGVAQPQPTDGSTGETPVPSPGTSPTPTETSGPGSVVTNLPGGAGNGPGGNGPGSSGPNGSATSPVPNNPVSGAGGAATIPTGAPGGAGVGGANGGNTNGAAGAGGQVIDGTPVERHGRLQVFGNRLHDEHDQPVTLRGQGFGWDNWWPQYYNADVVAWLRDDWCVDLVRPAMGIEPDGAYLQNAAASRARIQAVVDAAIVEGTYVIIDWHAHDMHQSEAVAFFSDMAETYGSSPNVIYEVYNEPDDETWPQVKAYAEAVIAAIRAHDPDNLVIVGSPEWDQRIDLVAADPISSDNNVIYSVHFYAGAHGQWLRDRVAGALAGGIPVLVSESGGSEASGMGANNYTEWEAWFSFMDQNQISWINYSVSDKAGETISVLEPGASASGGWDAAQLTETGEYIRDVFRAQCD
jgi:endoglucanase